MAMAEPIIITSPSLEKPVTKSPENRSLIEFMKATPGTKSISVEIIGIETSSINLLLVKLLLR